MQCPQCKQTMEPGVRYCPHDGTPLTDTAVVPTVTAPTVLRHDEKALELPVVVGGRYRLEKLLGGGGMAKVYHGVDLTLEREVAVKLINQELRADPEFDARFHREAKIASQLSDPHIIVVHDFGIDPTHGPYLVMELLQGSSLRERLQAHGPLPIKAALQLSAQLMLALLHAHEKGIVHRDIKPDNIFLLNQSGVRLHVRVLDFGIARIYKRDESAHSETLTAAGVVLGTPRYMSPEQLAGQPVDVRSDLYSAALVMHEAITGQLPYVSGKKLTELCPEASPALEEVLDHCLKPNPAERPPNAVEVYLRLQELGKASGVLLLPTGAMDKLVAARRAQQAGNPAITPPTKKASRIPIYFVVLLASVIGILGLVALGKKLFLSDVQRAPSAPETLLDLKIGDPDDEALEKKLHTDKEIIGLNPWAKKPPEYLGHILQPEDLGLDEEEMNKLSIKHNTDQTVCILFHSGKIIAVTVREPHKGRTERGVAIYSKVNDLYDLYNDVDAETRPGPQHSEIRRYDQRGVAFLIQGNVITSIALYPAKSAP
jgi:eukaryotic-like serine/threonine-protein kinase